MENVRKHAYKINGEENAYLALNDPFTDFNTVDELGYPSKLIFTSKAFIHFLQLIDQSHSSSSYSRSGVEEEKGCFFFGRELVEQFGKNCNTILIDSYSEDWKTTDSHILSGGSVDPNPTLSEVEHAVENLGYDCVIYFHIHPKKFHYDVFSTGDYLSFESVAKLDFMQNTSLLALLASPCRSTEKRNIYQFSCLYVQPFYNQDGKKDFHYYQFPHICYIEDEKVMEFGRFERRVAPSLSDNRRVPARHMIQGFGVDPNTGLNIQDKQIGTYRDGYFSFDEGYQYRRRRMR